MGKIWNLFYNYVVGRLSKPDNVEMIMKSFGALLITWLTGLFGAIIAAISGEPAGWIFMLSLGLGGTSQFLVLLLRTMFGKPNGNGTPPTPP
jgi:purine-cytosine permease-like protein